MLIRCMEADGRYVIIRSKLYASELEGGGVAPTPEGVEI